MLLKIQSETIFLLVLSVFATSFIECADGQKENLTTRIEELNNELQIVSQATVEIEAAKLHEKLKEVSSITKAIAKLETDLEKTIEQLQNRHERLSKAIQLAKEKRFAYPSDVRGFGYIYLSDLNEFDLEIRLLKKVMDALDRQCCALDSAITNLKDKEADFYLEEAFELGYGT